MHLPCGCRKRRIGMRGRGWSSGASVHDYSFCAEPHSGLHVEVRARESDSIDAESSLSKLVSDVNKYPPDIPIPSQDRIQMRRALASSFETKRQRSLPSLRTTCASFFSTPPPLNTSIIMSAIPPPRNDHSAQDPNLTHSSGAPRPHAGKMDIWDDVLTSVQKMTPIKMQRYALIIND